jgi:hypothetical protein
VRTRGPQITDRDREILGWIGRYGMVTAEQVAAKFFGRADGDVGKRAAYRRLAVLEDLRLLRRDRTPFWRAPNVLRVTTLGAEVGELGVRPARYVEGEIRHSIAVVDLAEELMAANAGAKLRTERETRTERWHSRQAADDIRGGRGRVPDAELTLKNGRVVGVELDLTPKRSKDFERILRAYKQERFDEVWWYVLPGAVERVTKLVTENRADDFVSVRAWSGAGTTPR